MKEQTNKQGLIWGGLLILLGLMWLTSNFVDLDAWLWVVVLGAGGGGIYVLYGKESDEKWTLIVSYVMIAVALLIALLTLNILRNGFVATYVLFAIGLPFLYVYFQSGRTAWYYLIPAYVLGAVGLMVPLIEFGILKDIMVASYVMFAVAIPFFVVYARNSEHWWALIPGGITAVIGFSFLLAADVANYIAPAALIVAGVWILSRQFTKKENE